MELGHGIDFVFLLLLVLGLPIVQVELKGHGIDGTAGPYATSAPLDDCTPPVVGLAGVTSSAGKIHEGERPGHAVLRTLSGSDLIVRLEALDDTSLRRGLLALQDFSRMFNFSA